MGESFELDAPEWITAGAVGDPGARTFYVQARQEDEVIALLAEKEQVRALARLAQELLGRAGVTVTPDDLDEDAHRPFDPPVVAWRIGSLSLGMDEAGTRFLLEADEWVDEDDVEGGNARFWLTRDQLVGLAAYAAFAVEAGARPTCQHCSRPMQPDGSHVCPAMNGHGPLSR